MSAETGKMVTFAELSSTRQVVCVDTLEAILNKYYFIELIQEAVANRETREAGLVLGSSWLAIEKMDVGLGIIGPLCI